MKALIYYALTHAHHHKTAKSIYNIITGKKSHQTFFDASSQQLLSLYHSLPHLKYPSFERFFEEFQNNYDDNNPTIYIHPRHTFESLVLTFKALQLFVQTLSHHVHDTYHFTPITEQRHIQQRVKHVFQEVRAQHLETDAQTEIYKLFQQLNSEISHSVLHYYLTGYEDSMYTSQQVSLIEGDPLSDIKVQEYNELVLCIKALEDKSTYPILSQFIMLPSLSHNTFKSLQLLRKGQSLEQIANLQNVKLNTIEDHLLEMFIKGYLNNYSTFVSSEDLAAFNTFYKQQSDARLKVYKEAFPNLTYFAIKLMIVGIERGDVSVKAST